MEDSGQEVAYAPIADVAAAYGVSVDTIRRRIRKGEMQGRKEQTPQGFKWLAVMPTPGEALPGAGASVPAVVEPALLDTLQRSLEVLHGQLEARDREIARLHDLLETALERPALPDGANNEAHNGPVSVDGASTGINTHDHKTAAPTGWWASFKRALLGE